MGLIERAHRSVGRFVPGTPIWAREWDICAILDGCRVDTFRKFHPDAGSYRSVAASSRQWIRRTFADAPDGTAYVTANPFLDDARTGNLAYVHHEPVRTVNGVETVPPSVLADHAAAIWANRDDFGVDRVVVHFMQPHVPFRARPEWFNCFSGTETWGSRRWNDLETGDIAESEWFDAYRDNLAWVLTRGVDRLRDRADAQVLVTADHGNAAGEWGVYGHPRGVAVPSVRRVPAMTVWGRQREPVPDVALVGDSLDATDRAEQLRALGYA